RRRYLLFGGRREVDSETQIRRAQHLLSSLLTLGPTFIKLGQLLSTRPDVLPKAYIDVLSSLQDDVPPADWEKARVVLEEELGPVGETFDEFDTDPISGASLGQVYRARVRGTDVAVKVRRPGVESLVEADLRVIKWSLPLLMRFVGEARAFSLENLADEFAKTIREEMDYKRERRILREIRGNFEGNDTLVIPEPVESASTARVLTMEYIPGTKINNLDRLDAKGLDRTELAKNLQEVYMQMIVEDGVFHADPHPGNLAVADDGTIIFYDFGMSGRVDPFIQEKIIDFYVAVAQQDTDAILQTLIEMGTISPTVDREVMGEVMELAIADARGEDIEQYRVNQVLSRVESTIYEFPLRLPRNLALILRVVTVLEGVCVTLDEDFDFIAVATDYLSREGYYEQTARELAERGVRQVRSTAEAMVTIPPKLDRTLDRLEQDNLSVNVVVKDDRDVFSKLAKRITYTLFVAVGVISASILYSFGSDWRVSLVVALLTLVPATLLYRSYRRPKAIPTRPQFTRQAIRNRKRDEQ
ncbi:MAG: AarF/ABC1/UbiB kinase family protein, partial [Haloferacaceae archaeon]